MSISNPNVPKLVLALRDYSRQTFLHDLLAGVTVGLVALPLAMAFGIASGVTPQAGLYTASLPDSLSQRWAVQEPRSEVQPAHSS